MHNTIILHPFTATHYDQALALWHNLNAQKGDVKMPESEFLRSDVWLLQAIMCANVDGNGTLDRILYCADGLNKTPMMDDELHSGLVRLTRGGYIVESDGQFTPTSKIPVGLPYGDFEQVTNLLGAETVAKGKSVGDPLNNLDYPGLTKEKIRGAEKLYHNRAHKESWKFSHPEY